jgi:hypothetical protein
MRIGKHYSFLLFASLLLSQVVIPNSQAQAKIATTTTLKSSLNPSIFGQPITLTATVIPASGTGTPTGSVTFKDGSTVIGMKMLSGGVATLTSTLNAGTHSITAIYGGDSNYNGSTSSALSQRVNKATTATSLTSAPNPSSFNQSVTFTATVTGQFGTPGAGTVTFTYGSITLCSAVALTGGVATCSYSTLPVGSDTVTAAYSGSGNYLASSGNETQTVNKASTTMTVTSAPNPSNFMQSVTFTVTVVGQYGGTPTGTATVSYSGGTLCIGTLASGVAICSSAALPVGADAVTASYGGDGNYLASSGGETQTVNKATTTTTLSSMPNPSNFMQSVTFTATVSGQFGGTPTGTVNVIYNGSTLCSGSLSGGVAACSSSALPVAPDSVAASYNGDSNYTGSTSSVLTQTVNAPANTFFVSPIGKDSWSGTLSVPNPTNTDGPFASVSRAQYAIQHAGRPAAVYLRAGTYYPALTPAATGSYVTNPGTLVFSSADSGTSLSAQVTWQAYPNDQPPVISGGVPANTDPSSGVGLNLQWTHAGNWYKATLPATLPGSGLPIEPFESLYYKGERRFRARVHDTGTSNGTNTYSVGYYMNGTTCSAIAGWPAGEFSTSLASCNLGSFLRVAATIPYQTDGTTCTLANSASDGNGNVKCLDRFVYTQSTGTGNDIIDNWTNLTSVTVAGQPCNATTKYPAGDVELTLFGAWTVDVMRVNCVDTTSHIIYLENATKAGTGKNYDFMGPTVNHRFVIENSLDAFTAAEGAGQLGIWFLDRSAGAGGWVLNYIANPNANPAEHPDQDYVVIPQLPQTGNQFPVGGQFPLMSGGKNLNDYIGGSLIWATGLQYVTFNGIDFEVDSFYPSLSTGFNNDVNGEMSVPQAIDCENCQFVTFNGITVRHTSGTGILAGATAVTTPCSTGAPPTSTSYCDLIENSSFYDIGDSGIRFGHYPQTTDTTAVVQDVLVQNNQVQGFSRVLADGEGIAAGNGYYNQVLNNTVSDGYHAGISICFNSCGHNTNNPATSDGNNTSVSNNLVSNLMQGITSDGGSIYLNVGGTGGSATGDQIFGNIAYNTTDSFIIDVVNGSKASGTGYGGEGIYLDAQTADADVENNLVFNVDGNAIHITEGLALQSETANKFVNNLFAYGTQGMFVEGSPWPNGCPGTNGQVKEVQLIDNLFVFDVKTGQTQTGRPGAAFTAIQGCKDSCISTTGATSYSDYQDFQGNAYWSYAESFGTISNAFQVLKNQGSGTGGVFQNPDGSYSCASGNPITSSLYQPLYFSQDPESWQGSSGTPVKMEEDPGGSANVDPHTNNTSFPMSGSSANTPGEFFIGNASGLGAFNPSGTNAAITGAGSTVAPPSSSCSTFVFNATSQAPAVCPTFPTYVYTQF